MSKISLKKITAFVMALVLIFSVTAVGTFAEQKVEPLFTIGDIETRQGEEFDVAVKFAQDIKPAGINISALDVTLKFNSEVFEVVKVAKGAGLTAAFDKLSKSTKLHLETGDYIYGASFKEEGTVKWSLSTLDGFTFAKDTDFSVITFKAKDFSNLEGDLTMTIEVTNAATNKFVDTTALYTPYENNVKVDVNLATLCDWEFDAAGKTYTLAKFNDKNATYFTIPDEYDADNGLGSFPVAKIKYGAFSTCSKLQNVTLGENIKTVDSGAFFNCTALKKVTVYSDDVSFGAMAFLGSKTNLTIRCMKGSTADKYAKNNSIKVEYFEDIASCNFTGLDEEKYYIGTPVELSALKIYNSYGVALKEGTDYDVEYENNTEIGTAKIHVTGKGEYWGSKDLEFKVLCPHHEIGDEYYTETAVYADCAEGGKLIKSCTYCGYNEETVLPKKEHTEKSWVTITDPTCKDKGLEALMCADCGVHFEEREIPVTECKMEWVIDKEASCTEDGEKHLECTMCGKKEEEHTVIPMVSHDDEDVYEWVTTKDATCTKDGEEKLMCKYCSDVKDSRTITHTGHAEADEWVVTKEVTCTEDGERQLLCKNCSEVIKTEAIKHQGHTAGYETVTIEATCEKDGAVQTICVDCGAVMASTPIDKLGHEKSDWVVIEEATCGKEGKEGIVCTRCGKEFETKVIEAYTHEPTDEYVVIKAATCTESGIEGIVCKHCGTGKVYERKIVPATDHDYSEWEIAVAPTCLEEGFKQSTCANCGDVKIEVVPATGHKQVYVADILPTYKSTGTEKLVCEYCGRDYHKTRVAPKVVPDLDGNGSVASADALMILQHATELMLLEGDALKNADCNGDGKVNSTDALLVLQLATGLISAN